MTIHWSEDGVEHAVPWHSENSSPAPTSVVLVDDSTTADAAFRLARKGTGLLWRGDHHNARQLLKAMDRRLTKAASRRPAKDDFAGHRAERTERARVLGLLIVELSADHTLELRRAPDVRAACDAAYGRPSPKVVSLTELLGVIGAHQWQTKGVPVAALGESVHPGYGVFSPVRGEYVELVAEAPFPTQSPRVFDLGTGTGVLAAVLARRGASDVVATDISARAVATATETMTRLDLGGVVTVIETDLYPDGRADVIVCNPPWLPGEPTSTLEAGIYDPDSDMLRRFIAGLCDHLEPGGEGWLVISDLAEHLGLRSREDLMSMFASAGLQVAGRLDTTPRHGRASDAKDALHAARRAEVTSLWRLVPAP